MTDDAIELAEVQGIGLATFAVTINLVRMLKEKGVLQQHEVQALVSTSLEVLSKDERISEQSVQNARELLSSVAESLGVKLAKPH